MKKILFLTSVITLLSTTGCLISERRAYGSHRGHGRHHIRSEVVVTHPVVVVQPPQIIIH